MFISAELLTGDNGLTLIERVRVGRGGLGHAVRNPAATVINNAISHGAAGNGVVFARIRRRKVSQRRHRSPQSGGGRAGGPGKSAGTVANPDIGKPPSGCSNIPVLACWW